mmetsp:Transcript_481/g.710  ORF Transcript_481/g.710 Transcript_481/m.710 type:complete len:152 (-) Transcript_481:1909-2364(-)
MKAKNSRCSSNTWKNNVPTGKASALPLLSPNITTNALARPTLTTTAIIEMGHITPHNVVADVGADAGVDADEDAVAIQNESVLVIINETASVITNQTATTIKETVATIRQRTTGNGTNEAAMPNIKSAGPATRQDTALPNADSVRRTITNS